MESFENNNNDTEFSIPEDNIEHELEELDDEEEDGVEFNEEEF